MQAEKKPEMMTFELWWVFLQKPGDRTLCVKTDGSEETHQIMTLNKDLQIQPGPQKGSLRLPNCVSPQDLYDTCHSKISGTDLAMQC